MLFLRDFVELCFTKLCDARFSRHLFLVSERVNPQSWPRLTEFRRPEDTSGRETLVTLVVAAVVFLDPSLQLPPDCQVSEVALPRFFIHFIPRQYTDKCKQDTKSLPPLFGPITQTLVPFSRGPGQLGDLSDI